MEVPCFQTDPNMTKHASFVSPENWEAMWCKICKGVSSNRLAPAGFLNLIPSHRPGEDTGRASLKSQQKKKEKAEESCFLMFFELVSWVNLGYFNMFLGLESPCLATKSKSLLIYPPTCDSKFVRLEVLAHSLKCSVHQLENAMDDCYAGLPSSKPTYKSPLWE